MEGENATAEGEPVENENFVTYKWLIGTMLSTLVICLTFIGITAGILSKALDSKVNKEVSSIQYSILSHDLQAIKDVVRLNAESLNKFSRNQELVLRALRIEPVK